MALTAEVYIRISYNPLLICARRPQDEERQRRDRDWMTTMRRTHRPAGSVPKPQGGFILKPRVSEAPPWVQSHHNPSPEGAL